VITGRSSKESGKQILSLDQRVVYGGWVIVKEEEDGKRAIAQTGIKSKHHLWL
jgi:hypothetical protein